MAAEDKNLTAASTAVLRETDDKLRQLTNAHMFRIFEFLTTVYDGDVTLNRARIQQFVFRARFLDLKVGTALISEQLKLPQSTVSRNLNALVADGMLKVEADPDDDRRRYFVPSSEAWEQGLQRQDEIIELHRRFLREVLELANADGAVSDSSIKQSKGKLGKYVALALFGVSAMELLD
jgi:DNA-binding MarR family transcriptional regulator